jgi:hypothetical protein
MDFFKLSPQLSNNRRAVDKQLENVTKSIENDDADLEQLSDLFAELSQKTFYTDLAQNEHGRATHMMYKTTFDSFQ